MLRCVSGSFRFLAAFCEDEVCTMNEPMSFCLSHTILPNPSATKLALVLHGALGSGQNFKGFIRKLQQHCPDYRFVLVDLRHHGDSSGGPLPDTLRACAEDLVELGKHLGQEPHVLIGHSFGGKVCIEYAHLDTPSLEQVWVLDSNPGKQDVSHQSGHEIERVIAAVRNVPLPMVNRKDVIDSLIESGLSSGIANWMTTNLRSIEGGYRWAFDLDRIDALLVDYFEIDQWEFLAKARTAPEFHMVVAENSDRWNNNMREKLSSLDTSNNVYFHELKDSGHWVHVDNPEGLFEIFEKHLI